MRNNQPRLFWSFLLAGYISNMPIYGILRVVGNRLGLSGGYQAGWRVDCQSAALWIFRCLLAYLRCAGLRINLYFASFKFVLQRKQGFLFSVGMSVAHTDLNIPDELPEIYTHITGFISCIPATRSRSVALAFLPAPHWPRLRKRPEFLPYWTAVERTFAPVMRGWPQSVWQVQGLLAVFLPSLGHNNPSFDRRDQTVPVCRLFSGKLRPFLGKLTIAVCGIALQRRKVRYKYPQNHWLAQFNASPILPLILEASWLLP